jgi:hypothetical protein
MQPDFCLATTADFNTLIAKSQETRTTVFALTPEQLGQVGVVLENTIRSRDTFAEEFHHLAKQIIKLTN